MFRSSELLGSVCDIFNNSEEFALFVDVDDTHTTCMSDVLGTLNPSSPPSPGPLDPEQLLKLINWTRKVTTFLVTKYDRSGHLDYGESRLRDIYDNFCSGPLCPNPIDHPKAACFMFAALGIVFNEVLNFVLCVLARTCSRYVTHTPLLQSNLPAWWTRMLPSGARCIIGLENGEGGERRADDVQVPASQAERRVRQRYANMWEGANSLFERYFREPEPSLQLVAPPPPRRNFDANTCIQLLNVLPANAEADSGLRLGALGLLRNFMAEDLAADAQPESPAPARRPTEPRRRVRASGRSPPTEPRRRGHSPSSASDYVPSERSERSDASSEGEGEGSNTSSVSEQ
jgi:hypothetical protein